MMTGEFKSALRRLERSCATVERQINEPVRFLSDALAAIRAAVKEESPELGHDLAAAQSILGKVHVAADGTDDDSRAQVYVDALRARIADAMRLAADAGYLLQEEMTGTPDRIEVARINHTEQLDRLEATIAELSSDIRDIKLLQEQDTNANERQQMLVQYFVGRAEIKITLIEINLKEVVELLGLGEAVAGLLRLVKSFVASVIPSSVGFAGWLKDKAEKLKPVAGAIGDAFKGLVSAIRKETKQAPPVRELTQEEAETEAKWLILADQKVPDHIAPLVKFLEFIDEEGLISARRLSNLINLHSLSFWGTQVSDVTPLAALANLQSLNLSETQVSDVTPLAALANLRSLGLMGSQVSDVTPLAALANLQYLDLQNTKVVDFLPVRHVPRLLTDDAKRWTRSTKSNPKRKS